MNLSRYFFIVLLLSFRLVPVTAQFVFTFDQAIPVIIDNQEIDFPWSGGLNSTQYNSADLNGDGIPDLILFDRTSYELMPFTSDGSQYVYAPEYVHLFPDDLEGWVLLRDFDCDGDQDIFTRSPLGVRVFKNTADPGEEIAFMLETNLILTEGFNGLINLQINITDIPALADIDADGDMDILTFNAATGGVVEYHRNMSIERNGNCLSLEFVREDQRWGDFEECFCGDIAFAQTCEEKNGRLLHTGGKSLLAFDHDGDGDMDLLFGDEVCSQLYFLENHGDPLNAQMSGFTADFPNGTHPIDFNIFPAPYYVDVTFDGVPDLLSAPNLFSNTGTVDFGSSSYLYQNNGSSDMPDFSFVKNRFLQDQMLDLGEFAAPETFDADFDGDLDLLIAYQYFDGATVRSAVALMENTGDPMSPEFELKETDWMQISTLGLKNLLVTLEDMDRDGKRDLVIFGVENPPILNMYFIPDESTDDEIAFFDLGNLQNTDFQITSQDHPVFFDPDANGFPDLLIGTAQGSLKYYRNEGLIPISYTLEEDNFLGISPNPSRSRLIPYITELDKNGFDELITIDQSGSMLVYKDFLQNPDPVISEEILKNPLFNQNLVTRISNTISIASYTYSNAEGRNDLIIGTREGGLRWMKHLPDGSGGEIKFALTIFPNPVDKSFLKVISSKMAEISLVNIQGKVIRESIPVVAGIPSVLDVSTLTPGMYVVIGQSGSKRITEKLIVY